MSSEEINMNTLLLSQYGYKQTSESSGLIIFIFIVGALVIGGAIIYMLYLCFKPKVMTKEDFIKIRYNDATRHIRESINIIEKTSNIETFFERGQFAYKRIGDIYAIEEEKGADHTLSQSLNEYFTSNFDRLIKNCYNEYYGKAHRELKTESGINNRLNRFWDIASNYLPPEEIERYKSMVGYKLQSGDHLIESDDWYNFEMNNKALIKKHTDTFEKPKQKAKDEKDLNKKIKLLENAISEFEKEKEWFYKTEAGKDYFQLQYENLHNSKRPCFEWLDPEREELEKCKLNRDVVIPQILKLASAPEGILQKDIYVQIPEASKSEVQNMVRYLEENDKISRAKKSGTYLITLKR